METFTDDFGLMVTQDAGGVWSRGGVTVGPCDQDQAELVFAGMAPDGWEVPATTIPIPQSVALWQAKAALAAAGKLDSATQIIAAIGGNIALAWEYGNTIDRSSPAIIAMGDRLKLTSEDIDALFIAAAGISV